MTGGEFETDSPVYGVKSVERPARKPALPPTILHFPPGGHELCEMCSCQQMIAAMKQTCVCVCICV